MTAHLQSWLLACLLNSVWQLPLLFCAGWLIARLARKVSLAAEHQVWVTVLLLQTLLPACSLAPLQHSGFAGLPWCRWLRSLLPWQSIATRNTGVTVTFGPASTLGTVRLTPAWLTALLTLYAVVTLYFAARFVWGAWKLALLRRASQPATLSSAAARHWHACSRHFRVYGVTLGTATGIPGPLSFGFRSPLILLPATMLATLPEPDLHTVLAHEFAHLQRNDFAKNLACELLRLPLTWHPVSWLTRSRLITSREILCDDLAAKAVSGRELYALTLLRLAVHLVGNRATPVPHAIGIFDSHHFERRIMQLTQEPRHLATPQRTVILAACIALGLATCASAIAMRTGTAAPANPQDNGTTSAGTARKPVKVSSAVLQGQVLTKVNPTYPQDAKEKKIQGAVVLNAVIDKDGLVQNLQVVSGPPELRTSALDAVHQWTYKPYLLNGNPVDVETTITVNYSLAP